MAGKPIATIGSNHVCPMVSGIVPHVGGPVTGPGAPNVLINGKPAALMGDMCVCAGGPDTIAQGEPTVLINGTPVATMGSMTAHGGSIVVGEPNVLISSATPAKNATMSIKKIPFPKITIKDRVGAAIKGKSKDLKEAEKNQKQIKEEAETEQEQEPKIFNLRWIKEEKMVNEYLIRKKVILRADVLNIDDGKSVTINVLPEDEPGIAADESDVKLTGTVKDGSVDVVWKVEESFNQKEENHNV